MTWLDEQLRGFEEDRAKHPRPEPTTEEFAAREAFHDRVAADLRAVRAEWTSADELSTATKHHRKHARNHDGVLDHAQCVARDDAQPEQWNQC